MLPSSNISPASFARFGSLMLSFQLLYFHLDETAEIKLFFHFKAKRILAGDMRVFKSHLFYSLQILGFGIPREVLHSCWKF